MPVMAGVQPGFLIIIWIVTGGMAPLYRRTVLNMACAATLLLSPLMEIPEAVLKELTVKYKEIGVV